PEIDFVKRVYRALCNHFSIAIGAGNLETYNLDIGAFIRKFDLDPLPTYNALKILELNGSIVFNEATFNPTKLKFVVNNSTLYNFQLKHESLDPIISYLSRNYAGIFNYFKEIKEQNIA